MADDETLELPEDETIVTVRDAAKREIDVRLVPFNKTISTRSGAEEFAPGSVTGTPDGSLFLMGLEHAATLGVDSSGQPTMKRTPTGRSVRVWEEPDGGYATFKVARTQQGDEILALAEDGIIRGVSVEFDTPRTVSEKITRAGRRISRITRAALTGAALTYRPAYGEQATVLAIRSQEDSMSEDTAPVASGFSQEDKNALLAAIGQTVSASTDALAGRLAAIEENARKDVDLPATRADDEKAPMTKGEWARLVLKAWSGEINPAQMRDLDEVVTSDNLGVVPPAYLTEIIGKIDASRPFLGSTRRLELPGAGMQIIVPKINQRPLVDIQDAEKDEVESRETHIGTETFDFVTIAGAGDISIQLLRRSSPAFLGLWLELLAEAYAQFAEEVALNALANAMGGWGGGTSLDPDDADFGAAFVTSFDAMRRPPDTLWLSTQAVSEFIDAKASGTNAPLYSTIVTNATAAGGVQGTISGLRVVHVPTLDAHGAYGIAGPSAGFAWTEDGPLTLSADIPAKAGRDVGIVGMLAPVPWYPDAFTLYDVSS